MCNQGLKSIIISKYLMWIFILSVMCLCPLMAQTESEEELLESLAEEQSSDILEKLQDLRENPININQAGTEEFRKIPFITQVFIHTIIRQRQKKGAFQSLEDFKGRLHIDPELWDTIKPYITIESSTFKDMSFTVRSRFQNNYVGEENFYDAYPGSVWKMYHRISLSRKNVFKSTLLAEKDAGEPHPADHLVGYIDLKNVYKNIRVIIGNYYITSGQGLTLWSPYGFSKGVYPVSSVKRNSSAVKGYASADENNFFTGSAAELSMGSFHIVLFGSGTRLDASFNADGTIKSFPASGYHRTAYERTTKERVAESLGGICFDINEAWGSIGATYLFTKYSHPVRYSEDKNLFSFEGRNHHILSLDFDCCFSRFNIFGEIAQCRTNNMALLTGCVYDADKIKGILLYRNFSPRFYSPHGHGFGSSSVTNERGVNIGLSTKIFKYTINLMFDIYHRPWRTFRVPVQVRGDDLYMWISKRISSHFKIKCKFKFRRKEVYDEYASNEGIPLDILKTQRQTSVRFELLSKFGQITFKTRVEWNHIYDTDIEKEWEYSNTNETGMLLFQDIDLGCFNFLNIRFRWIQFKTDSYISRVYEFENDLPGRFSIPFLYGEGYRWYMIGRLNIERHISFNVKYRETRIKKSAGYGNSICRGRKRYVGLQVDVMF